MIRQRTSHGPSSQHHHGGRRSPGSVRHLLTNASRMKPAQHSCMDHRLKASQEELDKQLNWAGAVARDCAACVLHASAPLSIAAVPCRPWMVLHTPAALHAGRPGLAGVPVAARCRPQAVTHYHSVHYNSLAEGAEALVWPFRPRARVWRRTIEPLCLHQRSITRST
jgi:hypothetical protein